jgi:two-component system NarL family sensor kinase
MKQAENSQLNLVGQMLAMQDEARRHVARELHDTTAQNLLCASIAIQRVTSMTHDLDVNRRQDLLASLRDAAELIARSQCEIRTLSYLLHPPMLNEAGLPAALRSFSAGFSKRTGLAINLNIQPELGGSSLALAVETALFRVAQEALANVHRHSGSARADLSLRLGGPGLRQVRLAVTDEGCGIPNDAERQAGGVGLMGMSERMRQIGGKLLLRSRDGVGTTVVALAPIGGSEQYRPGGERSAA